MRISYSLYRNLEYCLGGSARMKSIVTAVVISFFGMLTACGGGGEPTVPQAPLAEEPATNIGDHVVHFSAQTTDKLPPEVARAYNIVRSRNRAMITISVVENASKNSVIAKVTVKTVNLTGQLKNIVIRKIQEQEAIYYVGETPVANRETLIFEINVTPDGVDEPTELRFKRQFYSD